MNLYQIPFFKVSIVTILFITFLSACEPEYPVVIPEPTDYGYKIDLKSPMEGSTYQLGDTLPILLDFLSETGEIVHYVGVDVFQTSNRSNSLYSVTAHQHVFDIFTYSDICILDDTAKISNSSDWIIEASLWSHEINPDTVKVARIFQISN